MAESEPAPAATVETSPMAEEAGAPAEESAPNGEAAPNEKKAEAKEAVLELSEAKEASPSAADHKRKLDDAEGVEEKKYEGEAGVGGGEKASEVEAKVANPDEAIGDAKRQRVDGDVDGSGVNCQEIKELEALSVGNVQLPFTDSENIQSGQVESIQTSTEGLPRQGIIPSTEEATSRKIQVPNNKVAVLIGKAGETIRLIQNNSGAKIQIARDAETDPNSSTRPVELTGTLENINKAEGLIKNVIAEADAGGSPALAARGITASQSGSEEYEMQIPNEKVGLIIGKGGETIKKLQTETHVRIQLIPQHLPKGDPQKERTVRITGNKKQIEAAKYMINNAMNQTARRTSSLSTGHNQNPRPRGPQWGPRTPQGQFRPPNATHGYPPTGAYPSQYPQQSYGSSYPQQPAPNSNFSPGWDQHATAPVQAAGGYGANSGLVNYNYGQPQPQAAGYPQSSPYPQSGPQQSYGYNEPRYDGQAQSHQMYSQQQQQQQQPVSNQQGFYPQQGGTAPQTGYKPAPLTGAPQSYGPPTRAATQPGDLTYQGPVPPSYGSSGPSQQPYPYNSGAPSSQPAPVYGQSYGPPAGGADGYNNQPPHPAGYAQPNSQVAPSYGQPAAQSGGYGQAPPAAASNANYGYPNDAGYGAAPAVQSQPGYGQAGGYAQPPANTAIFNQSAAPQAAGYGTYPGNAPAIYTKGVSPQPGGYGWPV